MTRLALLSSLLFLGTFSASAEKTDLQVVRDLNYVGGDNPRQTLDLILPTAKAGKPRPIVVFIHGGGWRQGRKENGQRFLQPLVQGGEFAAASINYRLSQEAIWPAQIHDCKAAIRWIKANAAKYNIDPDRIAISGMSAGGHLASMIGSTGIKSPLEGKLGQHLEHSSHVQCVINLFGPSHFVTLDDKQDILNTRNPSPAVVRLLGTEPKQQLANARSASPTSHIDKNDPPVFIAHGDKDPLVPYKQSIAYEQQLQKGQVDCTLVKVQGAAHGFNSPEVNRRMLAFLQKHLHDKNVKIANTPVPPGQ